jgi:hypothetical protein
LAQPVSGLSLAAFRIAVGIVMLLEAISFFLPSESSGGRSHLDVYYAGKDIAFNLPYPGFGWLPLLPSPWIEGVGVLLGVGAVGMVLGFRYRVSALLTFLAWGYLYAVESTRTYWMSYYYLELIVLFLMVWMPAAARWSLDASRLGDRTPPEIPFWPVYLLRAQLVVTYFYAGFAKLNHDWLFEGVPVRLFLEKLWVAARLKSLVPDAWASGVDRAVHSPALIHFLGWTGAVFDLSIGALLLVRRTRALGFGLLLVFHGTNHGILFNDIVWFPLLGVATATIFLDPDWPARLGRWLTAPRLPKPEWRWACPAPCSFPASEPSSAGARIRRRPCPAPGPGPHSAVPRRPWSPHGSPSSPCSPCGNSSSRAIPVTPSRASPGAGASRLRSTAPTPASSPSSIRRCPSPRPTAPPASIGPRGGPIASSSARSTRCASTGPDNPSWWSCSIP